MTGATIEFLTDAALKSTTVLLIAACVTSLMSGASAAKRHMVWAAAVVALLLIPALSFVLPAWRVLPALQPQAAPPSLAFENTATTEKAAPAPAITTSQESAAPMEASTQVFEAPASRLSTTSLMLLTWLIGTLLVFATIVIGFGRVAWLGRRARAFPEGSCRELVEAMARQHGVHVELLEGDDFVMPMTWGVLRATLLLPRSAQHWPAARLHAVLRHELAHIRRRDPLWQLLGEVACALHWYNPLSWYAARRMRIEREHACDDAVLTAGSRASEYAAELLDIARSFRSARATSAAAIAMARPRQLEGRLLAVLDETRSRGDVKRRWPIWLAAALVVLPLAAIESVINEVAADIPTDASLPSHLSVESKSSERLVVKATPKATRRDLAALNQAPITQASTVNGVRALLPQQRRCLQESVRNMSITSHSDDDYQRVKWETRNCKGTMELHGKVRIAGDLSGFEYIAPGGKVVIAARDDDHKRELTLTPAANGFAYVYEVDGDRRTWDNDGKAWLSSIVELLVRRGGYGAEERVDYLLRTRGINGVLQEVAEMQSDYTQRLYLTKLLNKTTLNGGAVESVLKLAARELDSDYELTEFLIAVGNKYDFTAESRAAFIQATGTLQSDYEHRRALSAVLKKGGLSSEDVTAILTSATAIDSNHEKAELLIGIAGRYQLDQRMRSAYLTATRNMSSDYEKKRVFTTLLKQGGLGPADLAYVLDATSSVSSDYERGVILKLVSANIDLSQPQLQQAYVKAASEIDSDYELRQVLTALLKRDRVTPAALDVVLSSAATIDSDYERAELLTQILRNYQLTAEQRNRVIKMTDQMRSDYERGKVSSLLIKQMSNQ